MKSVTGKGAAICCTSILLNFHIGAFSVANPALGVEVNRNIDTVRQELCLQELSRYMMGQGGLGVTAVQVGSKPYLAS